MESFNFTIQKPICDINSYTLQHLKICTGKFYHSKPFSLYSLSNLNLLCESVLQRLPAPFTKMNGINEETKLTLLDKHGRKWSTTLRLDCEKSRRLRMVGGWKGFFQANCVKANESMMLELIWEEDTSCVLKFCSKVNL